MKNSIKSSGAVTIPSGDYDNISVSGSCTLLSDVRCVSFNASGNVGADALECEQDMKTSGNASFSGAVSADNIKASGSFSCRSDVLANDRIGVSGAFSADGRIKCNSLKVSGSLKCRSQIEAEEAKIDGAVKCDGLLNAERLDISCPGFSKTRMHIGSIGGSEISILENNGAFFKALPYAIRHTLHKVTVELCIEGDDIRLRHVKCPRVTGGSVVIGEGCEIDLVQYSESIEISPRAHVKKTEKI